MGGPFGPRPDPGPGGRAKPKPKVLQKGGVPYKAEILPHYGARDRAIQRRTANVQEAARAIREGRAEAHPIVLKTGLGRLATSRKEAEDLGKTFSKSLELSAERRRKSKILRPSPPRVPRGRQVAGVRKPRRRTVRRTSPRASGGGR